MGFRALPQIRENVKHLLKARGIDQKDLAFAIHKHPTTINKFLKGTREVQLGDLDAMADVLGVDVYQLFQPGLSSVTERRHHERRVGLERRVGPTKRQMLDVAAEIAAHAPDSFEQRVIAALLAQPTMLAHIAKLLHVAAPKVRERVAR
jgi:transcriptional regulator with XRE-family HTH domain